MTPRQRIITQAVARLSHIKQPTRRQIDEAIAAAYEHSARTQDWYFRASGEQIAQLRRDVGLLLTRGTINT